MDKEEISAAMEILDTDNSGVIEFDEFVAWWIEKVILLCNGLLISKCVILGET